MNFDKRNLYRQKGIANCDAGMCVSAGVDDDCFDTFFCCLLDPIDKITFVVALIGSKCSAGRFNEGS